MNGYIAANGQEITDALIDQWCEAYDQGEFPRGEHTVSDVIAGRPPSVHEGDRHAAKLHEASIAQGVPQKGN